MTAQRDVDREILMAALKDVSPDMANLLKKCQPKKRLQSDPIAGHCSTLLSIQDGRRIFMRIGFSAVGGVFLIGPMWITVLHNTLYTGLTSTTAFLTVFGLMAAVYLEEGKDVFAATAAYAAVLVVFVGFNTNS